MRTAGFVTVAIFLQRRVYNGSIFWLPAVGSARQRHSDEILPYYIFTCLGSSPSAETAHPTGRQEAVWNLPKGSELMHVCCPHIPQVGKALRLAKERLRHRRAVLCQWFAQAGSPLLWLTTTEL